jgi:hypothetical protein
MLQENDCFEEEKCLALPDKPKQNVEESALKDSKRVAFGHSICKECHKNL